MNLSLQIEKVLISGSNVILAGDINAKLGSKIIALDQCDTSANGKWLYDVYTKYDLVPLNSLEICSGVFTWVHHNNGKIEKSVLDYVFVNSALLANVKSWADWFTLDRFIKTLRELAFFHCFDRSLFLLNQLL